MRSVYPYGYGYSYFNPFPLIILILIVLQWFRVGGAEDPNDLTTNGGLFIITLFILVYCSAAVDRANALRVYQLQNRRRTYSRWFF